MPNNPLISIIIPTYNVESYIGRCLDSCINQTLGDIEIIVVDDNLESVLFIMKVILVYLVRGYKEKG